MGRSGGFLEAGHAPLPAYTKKAKLLMLHIHG